MPAKGSDMSAIQITFNGTALTLDDAHCTIADIVRAFAPHTGLFAVAVNDAVVPRSQHASTQVASGDRVEIVQAVGGG